MATVRGFRGLRYDGNVAGDLNNLVCPPYDIISDSEREEFLKINSSNIIRLELPQGQNRYKDAGNTLNEWLNSGILAQDDKDGIYVYEMEFEAYGEKKSVKGFVSLVKLEEFSKGIVLPHEETLSKAKQDRFNLMSETFCNFSQIYSLYMDEERKTYSLIDKYSQGEPDMEVMDEDGVVHKMWCVYDEDVLAEISSAFEDRKLYIADGHHRYETALNFHKHLCETGQATEGDLSGYIMMMLVDMENDGLVVFPTHRIIRDLETFDVDDVLRKCEEFFIVSKFDDISKIESKLSVHYKNNEKAFALYDGMGGYYILVLKDNDAVKSILSDMSDAYCGLDVSILHTLVLEKMLGIDKENMAQQINLTYTKKLSEALDIVDDGSANCAIILNPTRVSEIRDVALAREKMPQKSTYFYPKTITGMVMNKFK